VLCEVFPLMRMDAGVHYRRNQNVEENGGPAAGFFLDANYRLMLDAGVRYVGTAWTQEIATACTAADVHSFALMNSRGVAVREAPLTRGTRRRLRTKLPESDRLVFRWISLGNPDDESTLQHQGSDPTYMPFHLVRGHWVIYTADAPLFGWYVGQVFHRQHHRGNKAFGEIRHGYDLTPSEVS